ncbi:CBS domain-containing protein [Streptomyces sp. SLBN-31]|uniref:CBS domain-containing protein n=1 Tax=unclassified Streptomyces TaxID=2593676 RepID=UPI00116FAB43|nr:CBS domain-containing protein [Streptomyces sp. SLBN-31]TQJ86053.1 CBS domain protein [Streptomyces sp. SLBN-31]
MEPHIIGEVMTSEVVLAHRTTPFQELVGLLDRHRISGLPVVDHDDKVLGVVSGTDLARAATGTLTAGDLMSTPAVTVHPEQAVSDAARVMERHGIERLPVVDEEDRLIGIATRRDLLRVFARTDDTIRREVVDGIVVGVLGLPPESVDVTVRDGMVTLTGRVPRSSEIAPAVRSAWKIEGVVGVVNGLAYGDGDAGTREG